MGTGDLEAEYSQFVLSEHQCVPQGESSMFSTTSSNITSKYYDTIKETERRRIIGTLIRLLISRAPFPTRYDDIKWIIKDNVHENVKPVMYNCLIEDIKHVLSKSFGLLLYDIRTGGGKREFFLKQSLAFHRHDLLINDEDDHEIRGFLLLLVPCLKTCPAGLTLDRICDIFKKIGKGHLAPRSPGEQDDLKAALRTTRRRREVKRRISEFSSLLDYLVYAKDLGYLNIFIDANKGGNLDAIYIQAGQRLNIEFEQQSYMNQLNTLVMDGPLKRSLGIFFET